MFQAENNGARFHPYVCLSFIEAKYKALTASSKGAIWCRRCLEDIGQVQPKPTTLYCDNQGALTLSANPVFHARTKHVKAQHHFIWDAVKRGEVSVEYVHTTKNLANMLTKALPTETHKKHSSELALV